MPNPSEYQREIEALEWYHTVDLGSGVRTPGHYDHKPFLKYYGIPEDLSGKSVLDIGAASGYFSFEMEKRGAKVTATDLPAWYDHDFGPIYRADKDAAAGQRYLQEPFALAKHILGSQVERREINIYDISPESVGMYDITFCASVLLHVTDPVKALWRIQSVTKEYALIATAMEEEDVSTPLASFFGRHNADVWWFPNRACLEAMVEVAGFKSWEWVSDFRLDYADGRPGAYHGVIKAWNTPQNLTRQPARSRRDLADLHKLPELERSLAEKESEITRLKQLVAAYQNRKIVRWVDRLAGLLGR